MIKDDLYIVFACHGEAPWYRRKLLQLTQVKSERLFIVDTKNTERFGDDINKWHDFSAYQFGLNKALNEAGPSFDNMRIIFLNDTFFRGHINIFALANLKRTLCSTLGTPSGSCRFLGWVKELNDISYISYISTWLFAIVGSPLAIREVRFMCSGKDNAFIEKFGSESSDALKIQIREWIRPSGLLRGWQGFKGILMTEELYDIKRAITYSELTLPSRLEAVGFEMENSVNDARYRFSALYALDRAVHIVRKAASRIMVKHGSS